MSEHPTLTAIYSGAIGGSIFYYCKDAIAKITKWLVRIISIDITMRNLLRDSYIQDSLMAYIEKTKCYYRKAYELDYDSKIKLGYGTSWHKILGKLVKVTKGLDTGTVPVLTTTLTIFFCWNKEKFLKNLSEKVKIVKPENKISLKSSHSTMLKDKRSIDTVYTNGTIKQDLLADIRNFLNSKEFYTKYAIPYKRNYLLYGKPGTGKSSLIHAIASELDMDITTINLRDFRSAGDLSGMISRATEQRSLIVFEDIDAQTYLFNAREEGSLAPDGQSPKHSMPTEIEMEAEASSALIDADYARPARLDEQQLTLSDILNIFDGLLAVENSICIFTTNHINKLDPAFLRDGRMDYKVELQDLDYQTSTQMIYDKLNLSAGQYLPTNVDFSNARINPATLQEIWMRNLKNVDDLQTTKSKLVEIFSNKR